MALTHLDHPLPHEAIPHTHNGRKKHRRAFGFSIFLACLAQAVVTAAGVVGGNVVVGAIAALMIAMCGLALVFIAAQ